MYHALNQPHFVLSGDFDPDAITIRLGINPTLSRKAGAVDPETGCSAQTSVWALVCGDQEAGCDLQDQVIYMLSQLDSCKAEVAALCQEHTGNFNLFACVDGNIPGFWLDASTLRKLSQLNIDMDCRYLRSSELNGKGVN